MNKDRLIILAARAIGMIGNEWGKTSEGVWEWLNDDEEFEIYVCDKEDGEYHDKSFDVIGHRYDENIEFIKGKL